jgi:uncharacterized protein (DUF2267 family)
MSELGMLDKSVQKTAIWLKDAGEELNWRDERRAYAALRAVLHALRDRLTIQEAVQLGAQLPTLVRGFYYEGWVPREKPAHKRDKYKFLSEIQNAFGNRSRANIDSVQVAQAIFRLLNKKISEGEIGDVRSSLPEGIRGFWPEAPKTDTRKRVVGLPKKKLVRARSESVEELVAAAERSGRAVIGLSHTLQALNDGRVRRLVYAEALEAEGMECPQCAALFAAGRQYCACCESDLSAVGNVIALAIERAAKHGIETEALRGDAAEAMSKAGGIGAFLKTTRAAKLGLQ